MPEELRISFLGFGTVGQALAESLAARDHGIRIVSVSDSRGSVEDRRGLDPRALLEAKRAGSLARSAKDARWCVEHVDADVVVDLLPTDLRTGEPSLSLQLAALRRGKHVVTAAKGALALHGARLREASKLARREVRGSAAVCGGTPILELLRGAFHGDRVERFDAVLNGSTNHVLSAIESGETWERAVADARAKGILEADPSLDLLGHDAAAKAVILANAAWGTDLTLAHADVQGILGVSADEARAARERGLAIRLVARASPERGVSVAPVALGRDHPLVVDGAENVVRLKLAGAGSVTIRGPGAGGRETAAAVLSDLLAHADLPRARGPAIAA